MLYSVLYFAIKVSENVLLLDFLLRCRPVRGLNH